MKNSAPLRVTAIVAAIALCGISALTGCSALRDNAAADAADPAASSAPTDDPPTADPPGAGHVPISYLVSNWTAYTFKQGTTDSNVSASASQIAPDSAVTVDLNSGSSGQLDYLVYDADNTPLGTINLVFKDDLSTGLSIDADPLGNFGQNFNVFGADLPFGTGTTSGNTAAFFVDGVCQGSFDKGGSSIDQTIVNATDYTLTLDADLTASAYSKWYQPPPATLPPGGCAEINSYSDAPVMGYGFSAVYSFESSSGTQWAVFANEWSPPVSTQGGLTRESHVYSTKPVLTGNSWMGTLSDSMFMYDSGIYSQNDHVHLASVFGPLNPD